jgi:hypothetical protein
MKILSLGINVTGLVILIGSMVVLGGSRSIPITVRSTYTLTEVNGKPVPAISWITETGGERCEYLTSSGVLLLNREGKSGGFAIERIDCVSADGIDTSRVNDFLMITGRYEISGNRITIHDDVSTDEGILDGNILTVTVTGVGLFDGQTTQYVFELAR